MSRHRFYARPDQFDGATAHLSAEETHHLVHVVRARPGDEVFVFDGCGREYRTRYSAEAGKQARLEIVEELTDTVESPLKLTLGQALAKGDKLDLIVQKATELGVSRFVPLLTDHGDVRLSPAQVDSRLERWRRISLEGLKQCGRRKLVEISLCQSLEEFLNSRVFVPAAFEFLTGTVLVLSEKGGAAICDALAELSDKSAVTVLVGPEGGWSDRELNWLRDGGCTAVSLGPRVLRTETAAIAAVALIQHLAGDLSNPPSATPPAI